MASAIPWMECQGEVADPEHCPGCLACQTAPIIDANPLHGGTASQYDNALGMTLFTHESQRASVAAVFYNRVEEAPNQGTMSLPQILADIMDHELGHMLVRTRGHAPAGIMRTENGVRT